MGDTRPGRITPMYLAHHYPAEYERCVRVGQSHVCRRCLVLYPLAAVVMVATLAVHPDRTIDLIALVALPLPAVVELVLEQLGVLRYNARRQVVVTIPLAVGLGRGFAIYLGDQTSLVFWTVVVLYSAVTAGSIAWRHWREARTA